MSVLVVNHLNALGIPERVAEFMDYIKGENTELDFNKIIPLAENDSKCEKWGVRHNAYVVDCELEHGKNCVHLIFSTEGCTPMPILNALIGKFPDIIFHFYCNDEGLELFQYGSGVNGIFEINTCPTEIVMTDERKLDAIRSHLEYECELDPDEYDVRKILDEEDLCFTLMQSDGFDGFKDVVLDVWELPDDLEQYKV